MWETGRCEASSPTACSKAWAVRVMRGSVRSAIALRSQIVPEPPDGRLSFKAGRRFAPACIMPRQHVLIHVSNSCTKGPAMTSHATISPLEAADRLAIRELIDAYAHCADRRDAKGQMALFTGDTRFLVFMDATPAEPTQELHGRESLAPVFDDLNQYVPTMHFNGHSTIFLARARATAQSYC